MRLIGADALIKSIESDRNCSDMPSQWIDGVNYAIDIIELYEPTIDLVRCAECRKVREDGGHANCNGYLYCRKWKTIVDEDDYCSWGEREGE